MKRAVASPLCPDQTIWHRQHTQTAQIQCGQRFGFCQQRRFRGVLTSSLRRTTLPHPLLPEGHFCRKKAKRPEQNRISRLQKIMQSRNRSRGQSKLQSDGKAILPVYFGIARQTAYLGVASAYKRSSSAESAANRSLPGWRKPRFATAE